jgi:hypothetical protein
VTFEYRPHHWNMSLAIAGAGVLLVAALGVLGRKTSTGTVA